MKKRSSKIAITGIMLLSIIIFTACDKNSTEPEVNDPAKHPAKLVGTWHSITQSLDVIVTSKSAQKVANFFAAGNGSLMITGAHQAELKYMINGTEEDGTSIVIAANLPDLFEYGENDYPVYFLMFRKSLSPTVTLTAMLSQTEAVQYSGATTNLTHNQSNYSLTANNLQLFTMDSSASIIVNGTLSNITVDVPPNTPTSIFSIENHTETESIVILSGDGKYKRTSNYDWGTEESTGTWEVSDGDRLTIIETYQDNYNQTVTETTDRTFTISSTGVLSINFEMSVCEAFDYRESSESDCIRKFEEDFLIEQGSLTAVTVEGTYTLSKTAPGFLARSSIFDNCPAPGLTRWIGQPGFAAH